jgi:chromosome partitioning protein
MKPVTICLINQKGGCGKSSTCFHLAGHLAQHGGRVLLVDADPQGSLSQGFLGSSLVECLEAQETLAAIFLQQAFVYRESLCLQTPVENIALLPANQHLAAHNMPDPQTTGLRQFALHACLERLTGFDWVLIDCPPNLYQCSWNALLAAEYVLIPVPPEDFGTQGLRAVHQAIENAMPLNPALRLLGHLVTRYDRRLLVHQTYEQQLRRFYGPMVLQTLIPEASAFKVSLACRQPVGLYAARSKAAAAMEQLAQEIVGRVAMIGQRESIA